MAAVGLFEEPVEVGPGAEKDHSGGQVCRILDEAEDGERAGAEVEAVATRGEGAGVDGESGVAFDFDGVAQQGFPFVFGRRGGGVSSLAFEEADEDVGVTGGGITWGEVWDKSGGAGVRKWDFCGWESWF